MKDDSAGVYKCQGYLGDDMVAETTVTFDVLGREILCFISVMNSVCHYLTLESR